MSTKKLNEDVLKLLKASYKEAELAQAAFQKLVSHVYSTQGLDPRDSLDIDTGEITSFIPPETKEA